MASSQERDFTVCILYIYTIDHVHPLIPPSHLFFPRVHFSLWLSFRNDVKCLGFNNSNLTLLWLDGPANHQKATVTAPPFDISEIYTFSFFKKREIYFSIWVSVCMFVCLACLAYRYASGSYFAYIERWASFDGF